MAEDDGNGGPDLGKLDVHFTLAPDDRLSQSLGAHMGPLLRALSDESTRPKAVEILSHLSSRLAGSTSIHLPIQPLLHSLRTASSPFERNFANAFLTKAFNRADGDELAQLFPTVLCGVHRLPDRQQSALLRHSMQCLLHFRTLVADAPPLHWIADEEDKGVVIRFYEDCMLYRAPSSAAPSTTSGLHVPPGMSPAGARRLLDDHQRPLPPAQYAQWQHGILDLVTQHRLPEPDVFVLLLTASCAAASDVASRGTELLKRDAGRPLPLHTVDAVHHLVLGTARCAAAAQRPSCSREPRSPASSPLRLACIRAIVDSDVAAARLPDSLRVAFEAMLAPSSSTPLRLQGINYGGKIAEHAPAAAVPTVAPVLLSGFLKVVTKAGPVAAALQADEGSTGPAAAEESGGDETASLRDAAYRALALLITREPRLVASTIDVARTLVLALIHEPGPLKLTVQGTLSAVASAWDATVPEGRPVRVPAPLADAALALVRRCANHTEHRARVVAAEWAGRLYPPTHAASRTLCIQLAGDRSRPVREAADNALALSDALARWAARQEREAALARRFPTALGPREQSLPPPSAGSRAGRPALVGIGDLMVMVEPPLALQCGDAHCGPRPAGEADDGGASPLKVVLLQPASLRALVRLAWLALWVGPVQRSGRSLPALLHRLFAPKAPGQAPEEGDDRTASAVLGLCSCALEGLRRGLVRAEAAACLATCASVLRSVASAAPPALARLLATHLPALDAQVECPIDAVRRAVGVTVGALAPFADAANSGADANAAPSVAAACRVGAEQLRFAAEREEAGRVEARCGRLFAAAAAAAAAAEAAGSASSDQVQGLVSPLWAALFRAVQSPMDAVAGAGAHALAHFAERAPLPVPAGDASAIDVPREWTDALAPAASTSGRSAPGMAQAGPATAVFALAILRDRTEQATALLSRGGTAGAAASTRLVERLLVATGAVGSARVRGGDASAAASVAPSSPDVPAPELPLRNAPAEERAAVRQGFVSTLRDGVPGVRGAALRVLVGSVRSPHDPIHTAAAEAAALLAAPVGGAGEPECVTRCLVREFPAAGVADLRPEVRRATCMWLLGLVRLCGRAEAVQRALPTVHACALRLLRERSEATQEAAVHLLAASYAAAGEGSGAAGQSAAQQRLTSDLVHDLRGAAPEGAGRSPWGAAAVTSAAGTAAAATPPAAAPPGELGGAYREVCTLAVSIGAPSLTYTLAQLVVGEGPTGGLPGTDSAQLRTDLAPHMQRLVPEVFCARHDPNPRVRAAMVALWDAVVDDPRGLVRERLDALFPHVATVCNAGRWRQRAAAYRALAELCAGRSAAEAAPILPHLWDLAIKGLGDFEDTVLAAALDAVHAVQSLSARVCDVASLDEEAEAAGAGSPVTAAGQRAEAERAREMEARHQCCAACIPFLVDSGLEAAQPAAVMVSVQALVRVLRVSGSALQPHAPHTLPALLRACGSLEPAAMSYAQLSARRFEMSPEQVEATRLRVAEESPLQEAVSAVRDALLSLPPQERVGAVADLAPRLAALIRRGVFLPTRTGAADTIVALAERAADATRPHSASLAQALLDNLDDGSAAVRAAYARALARIAAISREEEVAVITRSLLMRYAHPGSRDAREVGALVLQQVHGESASEAVAATAGEVVATALVARFDEVKEVHRAWTKVWGLVASSSAIRRHAAEVGARIRELLGCGAWNLRRQAARGARELAPLVAADSAIAATSADLVPVLLGTVSRGGWDGMEEAVAAAAELGHALAAVRGDAAVAQSALETLLPLAQGHGAAVDRKPLRRAVLDAVTTLCDASRSASGEPALSAALAAALAEATAGAVTARDRVDSVSRMRACGAAAAAWLALEAVDEARAAAGVEPLVAALGDSFEDAAWGVQAAAMEALGRVVPRLPEGVAKAHAPSLVATARRVAAETKHAKLRAAAESVAARFADRVPGV